MTLHTRTSFTHWYPRPARLVRVWAPLATVCSGNPQHGIPSTPVTTTHVTQRIVQYESITPRSSDEGLDLWEASQRCNKSDELYQRCIDMCSKYIFV
jgi:hypothetical protein